MSARLYYSRDCAKCVSLARIVTRLAMGTIEPIAMEIDETWRFYTERFPNAWGYPVLVTPNGATTGPQVFLATAAWVAGSWIKKLSRSP